LLEFEEYQLPQQCTAKSLLILLDATCGVLFSTASTLSTAAVLSTVGQVLGPLVVAVGAFVKLPITDQNNDPSDTDTMLFGILASLFPNRDTSSGDIENCLCLGGMLSSTFMMGIQQRGSLLDYVNYCMMNLRSISAVIEFVGKRLQSTPQSTAAVEFGLSLCQSVLVPLIHLVLYRVNSIRNAGANDIGLLDAMAEGTHECFLALDNGINLLQMKSAGGSSVFSQQVQPLFDSICQQILGPLLAQWKDDVDHATVVVNSFSNIVRLDVVMSYIWCYHCI
jgi:hypothetical protein